MHRALSAWLEPGEVQLPEGGTMERPAPGTHEVRHGLGLDEIDLPVQVGPAGELFDGASCWFG